MNKDTAHSIPDYRIVINDNNVTSLIQGRLISLTLKDERGNKADQLDITLDDSNDQLTLPNKKSVIQVWLGYKEKGFKHQPLIFKGSFTVDEINYSHQNGTDTLRITARSADFKGPLKVKREKSWHNLTLESIINTIATRHDLKPRISPTLATEKIDHIDQTDESDIAFLNRVAKRFDAICSIKSGHLLFAEIGKATTVSGKPLPTLTINKADCTSYSYQTMDRESDYTGVQSYWNDKKYARRKTVIAGDGENPKILRNTYPSEQQAEQAAKAEWKKLNREQASMSFDLAVGLPDVLPEMPVALNGFKKEMKVQFQGIESIEHILTVRDLRSSIKTSTSSLIL